MREDLGVDVLAIDTPSQAMQGNTKVFVCKPQYLSRSVLSRTGLVSRLVYRRQHLQVESKVEEPVVGFRRGSVCVFEAGGPLERVHTTTQQCFLGSFEVADLHHFSSCGKDMHVSSHISIISTFGVVPPQNM